MTTVSLDHKCDECEASLTYTTGRANVLWRAAFPIESLCEHTVQDPERLATIQNLKNFFEDNEPDYYTDVDNWIEDYTAEKLDVYADWIVEQDPSQRIIDKIRNEYCEALEMELAAVADFEFCKRGLPVHPRRYE